MISTKRQVKAVKLDQVERKVDRKPCVTSVILFENSFRENSLSF